jgi:hypothetical protein
LTDGMFGSKKTAGPTEVEPAVIACVRTKPHAV